MEGAHMRTRPPISRPQLRALIACSVGMMSSLVAIFIGTFPLFLEPVSASMGWSRTTFPAILMAIALTGALFGPLVGHLIDRFGARPVAIAGTALWGTGLVLLSRFGPSLPLQVPAVLCLAAGGGLAGQLVYARVISLWFTDNRGMMLGIVLGTAPALSQALAAPVANMLIAGPGWRTAYLAFGATILCVTLTLNVLFLREPARAKAGTLAAAAGAIGDSARIALGSARFWILTVAVGLGTAVYNGIFQHSVAIIAGKGLHRDLGTLFVSLTALAAIPSPLLAGMLLDRVKSSRMAVVPFFLCELVGAVLICNLERPAAILSAAILLGMTLGAGPVIQPFLLTRYFGVKAQSQIFGASLIGIIAGTAAGPVLMGALFDRTGSYKTGLVVFEILALIAVALSLLLPSYRYAEGADVPLEVAIPRAR